MNNRDACEKINLYELGINAILGAIAHCFGIFTSVHTAAAAAAAGSQ